MHYTYAMFTGLVEEVGSLQQRSTRGPGARLRIRARLGPLVLGESIAVDGACLTVCNVTPDGFEADASFETLQRTSLGRTAIGGALHLERAVAAGGRLGGHLVTGHVDGLATLRKRSDVGSATVLIWLFPIGLRRMVAAKGSIALAGVSLTVNEVGEDTFSVTIIPHTLGATHLGSLRVGDVVNVEIDPLARYVARWLETAPSDGGAEPSTPRSRDEDWAARLALLTPVRRED